MQNPKDDDWSFIASYIIKVAGNITLRYRNNKTFPELDNNRQEVARSYFAKRDEYHDSSSLFLLSLIELVAHCGFEELYSQLRDMIIESDVNLQVVYARKDVDIELAIFDGNVYKHVCVETSISIPETIEMFRKSFRKRYHKIDYRTNNANFDFILTLAHIYHEVDFLPDFLNLGYAELLDSTEES